MCKQMKKKVLKSRCFRRLHSRLYTVYRIQNLTTFLSDFARWQHHGNDCGFPHINNRTTKESWAKLWTNILTHLPTSHTWWHETIEMVWNAQLGMYKPTKGTDSISFSIRNTIECLIGGDSSTTASIRKTTWKCATAKVNANKYYYIWLGLNSCCFPTNLQSFFNFLRLPFIDIDRRARRHTLRAVDSIHLSNAGARCLGSTAFGWTFRMFKWMSKSPTHTRHGDWYQSKPKHSIERNNELVQNCSSVLQSNSSTTINELLRRLYHPKSDSNVM